MTGLLFSFRYLAALLVLAAVPYSFGCAVVFGATGLSFGVSFAVYVVLCGIACVVGLWRERPLLRVSPVPVETPFVVVRTEESGVNYDRHTTTCALNTTGHRGPCTCGARRV